jgi:Ca2+-binding RTX toxin-like protein
MTSGETLTLTGSRAATVTVGGNLSAGSDTGALTVTATGSGTIQTGNGADSIMAALGGDTIQGGGGGDNINVSNHTVLDSFIYAATSASLNTVAGHDTITGFSAGLNDRLDFSQLNPNLTIQQAPLPSGSTVAADSIAFIYTLAGNAMVYVNNTASALATSNTSLMEITLTGVSSGLTASNFKA